MHLIAQTKETYFNSPPFWVIEPLIRYVWSKLKLFTQKNEDFDQMYLIKGSITQNLGRVKPRSDIP